MSLPINKIKQGSALEVLKDMPDESISCCISSPPYWALRDYGTDGQLGLEPTFEEYIDKLCTIYDEVRRVLRKDGTCFVNLGDTYGGSGGHHQEGHIVKPTSKGFQHLAKSTKESGTKGNKSNAKSLCLIPQRFAIEMVNRGWILRNTIIWNKPNPMPSSAKDRFTVDFEYVYFFVKSKKYFFEPQYEPHARIWNPETNNPKCFIGEAKYQQGGPMLSDKSFNEGPNPLGRNKRCVWTIPTQPFPEAHFATYPEKLVEPMIKAGCPEFICSKCGKPRVKVYDRPKPPDEAYTQARRPEDMHIASSPLGGGKGSGQKMQNWLNENPPIFKGYTDCGCGAEFEPGVVWDPFVGSGTTLQVAARLGRNYGGSELKGEYIEMANKRVMQGESGIPVKEQKQGQQPLFPVERQCHTRHT